MATEEKKLPRVVWKGGAYRVIETTVTLNQRTPLGNLGRGRGFIVENRTGEDALGVPRWETIYGEDSSVAALASGLGELAAEKIDAALAAPPAPSDEETRLLEALRASIEADAEASASNRPVAEENGFDASVRRRWALERFYQARAKGRARASAPLDAAIEPEPAPPADPMPDVPSPASDDIPF